MKEKSAKRNIREVLTDSMDIPKEISQDVSKIMLSGEKELIIENYKGILEYDGSLVRIKTVGRNIRIEGKNLEIQTVTDDDIQVSGTINKFEFYI